MTPLSESSRTYYSPAWDEPGQGLLVDQAWFDSEEDCQAWVEAWNRHESNERYFVVKVTKYEKVERV